MLITRLNCTVQSFKWSEKLKIDKNKEKEINERFANKIQAIEKLLVGSEDTDIGALLTVRDRLAIIEKTSSANVRKNTKCKIQRHIIGRVPDRGGRAHEHQGNGYILAISKNFTTYKILLLFLQVPAPEMPSWQKRTAPGNSNYQQNQHQNNRGGGYNQQNNRGGGYNQQNYNQGSNRGGGGGRVQGGWSQKGYQNQSGSNYEQQGSYRGGRR